MTGCRPIQVPGCDQVDWEHLLGGGYECTRAEAMEGLRSHGPLSSELQRTSESEVDGRLPFVVPSTGTMVPGYDNTQYTYYILRNNNTYRT